jgi:methyl-accepting chemotaxis protein
MDQSPRYIQTISFKLLLSITIIIILISSTIGFLSYDFAKKELVNSGKLDLQHIVKAVIPTLDNLNKQVETGQITLKQAQDMARIQLLGPVKKQGNNVSYDYSNSSFLYGKEGYLFAYDQKGRVVLHPTMATGTNKYNAQNSEGVYVIREILKAAHANTTEGHYFTYSWKNPGESNEREKISYNIYFKPWGWNIGIGAYSDEFYASLGSLKILITLFSIGIAFISLLVFYFITKPKMRLLKQVSEASLQIANGELNLSKLPEGKDEIGQLGASFNVMAMQLRTMMRKLQETSSHLIESAGDLAAVSEETSASSEEISAAMEEISASAVTQAEEVEKTNKQMELLTSSIKNIKEVSSKIKEVTNISKEATSHGKEMVSVLLNANNETEKASEKISLGISNLYLKVQEISKITVAIQYITQQTNLLALNASIEAARAGEHGKGFSVVANEVRKLAEESNEATKQIQEMIAGIEKETESTVQYMAETVNSAKLLKDSVTNTKKEFDQIEKAVSLTIESVEVLNGEMNAVIEKTDQMVDAVQNIAATSQQTAASSEEVAASLDEQVRATTNVSTSAEGLNTINEKLNSIIRQYRFE